MAYQIETTCICGDPETSKNHSFGAVSVPDSDAAGGGDYGGNVRDGTVWKG